MAFEIQLPALGEGITDAALVRWLVNIGDKIEKDTPVAEIATDKVDTEILSPVDGILEKILFPENSVIKIGETIALINTGDSVSSEADSVVSEKISILDARSLVTHTSEEVVSKPVPLFHGQLNGTPGNKFISPFVRNLAYSEGISVQELNEMPGSGAEGRLTKEDILSYVLTRKPKPVEKSQIQDIKISVKEEKVVPVNTENEEYIELDRVRKMIADNMLKSKQTAPHVTSFVDVNITKIVEWRSKNKDAFKMKNGTNLTFMPFFIEAATKALRDFPSINASLQNDYLVLKKQINIGVATALPDGNLVVPVIKNVAEKNITSIAIELNDIALRARQQKLQLSEIKDGTFTITNAGTFGNIGGTPIIRQPELAILAVGSVIKKPVALKLGNDYGVAIQDMVELWLSYDHRVVDGILGGSFLKRIADYLEQFDDTTSV